MKLSAGPDALLKEKTKQKRQREGYEEGISTTARPASAASFLASEKPVEALGHFTRCRPCSVSTPSYPSPQNPPKCGFLSAACFISACWRLHYVPRGGLPPVASSWKADRKPYPLCPRR